MSTWTYGFPYFGTTLYGKYLRSLYTSLTPDEKQQAIDTFTDKYLSIHDPKQFPNAANNVKYLTTGTFKGAL